MVLVAAGTARWKARTRSTGWPRPLGAQPATLAASVAGGDEPTAFVSVEATDVAAAREAGETVVGTALERVGRSGQAVAMIVFAEDGRVAYERSESS
jgi:hypothetical protein